MWVKNNDFSFNKMFASHAVHKKVLYTILIFASITFFECSLTILISIKIAIPRRSGKTEETAGRKCQPRFKPQWFSMGVITRVAHGCWELLQFTVSAF